MLGPPCVRHPQRCHVLPISSSVRTDLHGFHALTHRPVQLRDGLWSKLARRFQPMSRLKPFHALDHIAGI